jgi:hypothetical protein
VNDGDFEPGDDARWRAALARRLFVDRHGDRLEVWLPADVAVQAELVELVEYLDRRGEHAWEVELVVRRSTQVLRFRYPSEARARVERLVDRWL